VVHLQAGDFTRTNGRASFIRVLCDAETTARRGAREERLRVDEVLAVACAEKLLVGKLPGVKLLGAKQAEARVVIKQAIDFLGLGEWGIKFLSWRRGGAT
jgi:hypothetical protein